ncbi:transposase [Streptococcus sp. HMSC061D10]|nr:transposase [Streptococcus sp. HMSC061D10]
MRNYPQDFDNLNIITVLEGRTQSIIRNHFLKYESSVRSRVKIITMDMFSPYYDLTRQLRFRISRLRLKQSTRLFHSQTLKSFWIAFTLYNI